MATNFAWCETAYVTLSFQSGTDIEFRAITETIDIDGIEKDFESIATIGGGRIVKFTPSPDITVTLEAYPLEVGTASGDTGKGFFDFMNSSSIGGSQPLEIEFSRTRKPVRLAILFTEDTSVTKATDATNAGYKATRFVFVDGYVTSVKPSYTDKVLKYTITVKFPPFDSSGNANFKVESDDGTGTGLSALSAYTSSTKW